MRKCEIINKNIADYVKKISNYLQNGCTIITF